MSEPHQNFAAKLTYRSALQSGSFSGRFRRYLDGRLVGAMSDKTLVLGTMDDAQTNFVNISPNSMIYALNRNQAGGYSGTFDRGNTGEVLWTIPELDEISKLVKTDDILKRLGEINKSKIEANLSKGAIERARKSLDSAELDIWEFGAVTP